MENDIDRPRLWGWARQVGTVLMLIAGACSEDSAHQVLALGGVESAVSIDVRDESGDIASAAVFYPSLTPAFIDAGGGDIEHEPLVRLPADGRFDFEVVYRSGPRCNAAPVVTVREARAGLQVTVESFDRAYSRADTEFRCPDTTYSVAIGFVLHADAPSPGSISASHIAS